MIDPNTQRADPGVRLKQAMRERIGGGYAKRRSTLYRAFARRGQHIELLRCDSHDPSTGEWKASETATEFVADWTQGGYGLGVVTRSSGSPPDGAV